MSYILKNFTKTFTLLTLFIFSFYNFTGYENNSKKSLDNEWVLKDVSGMFNERGFSSSN